MPKRYYVGALDEIATILLDGMPVYIARGDSIDVSADDAARFDLQPDNWSPDAPISDQPKKGAK